MKRSLPFAGLVVLLALAGCGSSSSKSSSSPAPAAAAPSTTTTTTASASASGGAAGTMVALRSSKLGRYLVDGSGRTVYLFLADRGGKSSCHGACAKVWEPLATKGAPVAASGVSAAKLSTAMRTDGVIQVVYNGHPLYHYDDDHHAGQMEGQGKKEFGAEWYVLSPAGAKLEAKGS